MPVSVTIPLNDVGNLQRTKPDKAVSAFKLIPKAAAADSGDKVFHVLKSSVDWVPSFEKRDELCDAMEAQLLQLRAAALADAEATFLGHRTPRCPRQIA